MNNLKQRVIESLKWKKHPSYCADRLNITESQYIKLKKEVLSERKKKKKKTLFFSKAADNAQIAEAIDLEKGEGKISGTFDHEPKSAEEIIQLLKIDTNKWKLSQYWNKQMGDHWRVSALVSQIKNSEEKLFKNLLESFNPYVALFISSIFFSLIHGSNPNVTTLGLCNIFLAGFFLGASYIFTKNLWFPIALHFSWNFFQSMFGFKVSGLDSYSIIEFTIPENNMLNGGEFGFESSFLSIIILIIATFIIWNYFKKNNIEKS